MKTGRGKRTALLVGALALVVLGVAAWRGWPHVRFWWLFESLGPNAQGLAEYRHRQTGIIFVRVPGGKFWMGTSEEESSELLREYGELLEARGYHPPFEEVLGFEKPRHLANLSPFLICKYEVTQSQWEYVMGNNPCEFKGPVVPVQQVSWEECQQFCVKTGLRLPTECQWEYACRAGKEGPAPGKLEDMDWCQKNSHARPHPVGQKGPNGIGLHDMGGNVFEWCEDVFDPSFYSTPEAALVDPVRTGGSSFRVYRGGCCNYGGWLCRPGARGWDKPTGAGGYLGFRAAYWPLP